jgi:enolase-phosphatase E1
VPRTDVPAGAPGLSGLGPDRTVGALLLDVEGTTTPLRFVHDVLFPYARAEAEAFLRRVPRAEAHALVSALRAEHEHDAAAPPPWRGDDEVRSALDYVFWLMDRDRKSTALKSLQGRIWEEGYLSGALRGEVYPDVPHAFAGWRRQGRDIAIFSSGSVLAQKLLFRYSTAGDLTPYIRAYFDTTTGPKREDESYRRIAAGLERTPAEVLFVSDVAFELDAARTAGMQTALCVREGPAPTGGPHDVVRDLEALRP